VSLYGRKTKGRDRNQISTLSDDYDDKVSELTETLSMFRGLANSSSRSGLMLVILSREWQRRDWTCLWTCMCRHCLDAAMEAGRSLGISQGELADLNAPGGWDGVE
jgi:hypothetical protein